MEKDSTKELAGRSTSSALTGNPFVLYKDWTHDIFVTKRQTLYLNKKANGNLALMQVTFSKMCDVQFHIETCKVAVKRLPGVFVPGTQFCQAYVHGR
jgi:hypothetical protein